MEGFRRLLVIAAVAAVIVGIGVVIGLVATGGREVTVTSPQPGPAGSAPATGSAPLVPRRTSITTSPVPAVVQTNAAVSAAPAVSSNQLPLLTDWAERLDAVLEANEPEARKAKRLLEIFPRLPDDGKVEVAEHLTNLVPDEEYASLGSWLTNTALPEDVLDTLLSDLLNRPNTLKLPLLVDVARDPSNPKAGEAKDLLELYLEEDYGTDWATWRTKAEEWLKENPD